MSFCWPLLMNFFSVLLPVLLVVSFETVVLWMCTQAIVCLFVVIPSSPTNDPYIPRAKRPPCYLQPFLTWVNTAIEQFVVKLSPLIIVRRHSTSFTAFFPHASPSTPQVWSQDLSRFKNCGRLIFTSFKRLIFTLCKWKFAWWHARQRPHPPFSSQQQVLALSAITAGIVRAQAATSSRESARAIFDSNSFDILVDGGATSCISNSLSDFINPPVDYSVRVKGFNGTKSATKTGKMCQAWVSRVPQ